MTLSPMSNPTLPLRHMTHLETSSVLRHCAGARRNTAERELREGPWLQRFCACRDLDSTPEAILEVVVKRFSLLKPTLSFQMAFQKVHTLSPPVQ